MRDLKYNIVKLPDGTLVAIIFNGMISHINMVPKGCTIFSAGFCTISTKPYREFDITTWGHSSSLNVGFKPNDVTIIEKTLDRSILGKSFESGFDY